MRELEDAQTHPAKAMKPSQNAGPLTEEATPQHWRHKPQKLEAQTLLMGTRQQKKKPQSKTS